ncbi:branched-chain amino acid ABC transporter permease [Methylobacterium sp. Leaf100]|uniref:branched-chain amino acid ABC transporter permease n=1 Tax=Methylobacterium sp. Leaf100 TaxID=1736252 RepID=UPI0006FCABD0|nr:branched-chain amino acid ABC transporter permease [Methylobacterium sp. Leaf100]KQP30983.1 ABC transporter permease [Methylobacterium sp. Leaf100]
MLTGTLVTGLGLGAMYGLIALGFHITYAVSGTVNFAQGSAVTLGAVLGYWLGVTLGWPMPLAIPLALAGCALLGVAVERLLVRPFVERGSDAWLLATVAGGIILDNTLLFTFGKEPRSLPSPLAVSPVQIFGAGIYPLQLVIPVLGVAVALAIRTVFRRTDLGRVLLAVAQNADAARLMGIDVRRTVACAFALSAVLAGMAGLLIAPLFSVSAEMGALFGIKAFAVAILGGIGSATGVVVAGLLYGLVEATVTATLGSAYTQLVVFSVIILALALRPDGLFGRSAVNKV